MVVTGVDDLRIPFEKIKRGRQLESQGYGTVCEGEFDNQRVALKKLNITNLANIKPTLLDEILTIYRFGQHPNVVSLLGFCDEHDEMILVYEYVANGNLGGPLMKRITTIQRLELCLGVARGLCYLHTGVDATTPGIVHGNIKLSKILLNSKFEAVVSSFGLSKTMPGKSNKTRESSYGVTEDPTKESDIYDFGMLLLIVFFGGPNLPDTDDCSRMYHVSELVPKKMKQNKLWNTVQSYIRKEIKTKALETYAKVACQCVMENPEDRPNMDQVIEELEKALRLQNSSTEEDVKGSDKLDDVKEANYKEVNNATKISETDVDVNEGEPKTENENIPSTKEDVKGLRKFDDVKDVGEASKISETEVDVGEAKMENENISSTKDDVKRSDKLDDIKEANDDEANNANKISKTKVDVKEREAKIVNENIPSTKEDVKGSLKLDDVKEANDDDTDDASKISETKVDVKERNPKTETANIPSTKEDVKGSLKLDDVKETNDDDVDNASKISETEVDVKEAEAKTKNENIPRTKKDMKGLDNLDDVKEVNNDQVSNASKISETEVNVKEGEAKTKNTNNQSTKEVNGSNKLADVKEAHDEEVNNASKVSKTGLDTKEGEAKTENEHIPSTKDVKGLDILDDAGEANPKTADTTSNFETNTRKATKILALYWTRVLSLKKAPQDWITKDCAIGIGIAIAIALLVGGISATLILIRD